MDIDKSESIFASLYEDEIRDHRFDSIYRHRQLAEDEIRLIRCSFEPDISLTVQHHLLGAELYPGSKVEYNALSYCWGDPDDLCDVAFEGGFQLPIKPQPKPDFPITRHLMTILEQIKTCHPELSTQLWWIDQICIDQYNVNERNQQVHRMWRIFSEAKHVYAWIGEDTAVRQGASIHTESGPNLLQPHFDNMPLVNENDEDEVALPIVTQAHRLNPRWMMRRLVKSDEDTAPETRHDMLAVPLSKSGWTEEQGFHVDKELVQCVMAMLDQPYFFRTWIVPEMLQALHLTFLFGSRRCPARDLLFALDVLFRSGWKWDVQKLVKIKQLMHMRAVKPWLDKAVSRRSGFLNTLELLHETECADIRDRIFAALSIPGLATTQTRDGLQPDYRLSRHEIAVLVIAYYDKLNDGPLDMRRLSRTLARSLMLGDGTNITTVYHTDVAASILSCTKPWAEGEPLFLQSGVEVGWPGPCMRLYLSKSSLGYH